MKTTRNMLTVVMMIAGIGLILFANTHASGGTIGFGTMTTDGDNGDGAWQTSDGWTFGTNAGDQANDGSPDGKSFWAQSYGMGTSDGDLLAAGDYSINFKYAATYSGSQLLVEAFAWDGSIQTSLGSDTPTMGGWTDGSLSFSVSSGSPVIGDQLQLKFSNISTSYLGWDTITGDFTAAPPSGDDIPEPATMCALGLAVAGLGGYVKKRRRITMKTTRNRTRTVLTLAAVAMAGLVFTASANAAAITINNAGFEDASGSGPRGNLTTPADWTEENPDQVYVDNNGLAWKPEADRVLYLNAAGTAVNQDLSHNWSSSDSYTLGIIGHEAGWQTSSAGDAFSVELRETDGTVLWDSGSQNVDGTVTGSQNNYSYTGTGHIFNWTIDASSFGGVSGAAAGSQFNIRISRTGGNPYLDDVSLSVSTPEPEGEIPEPATMALLGLAFAGLGGYVRKRRSI